MTSSGEPRDRHWGRRGHEEGHSPRASRSRHERSSRHDLYDTHRHHRYESERRHRHHRDSRERSPPQPRNPPPSEAPPSVPAPNFERSGLLAKESNNVNGVALKYHEPPEAKKPRHPWRMFVFKDGKEIGAWVILTTDMFVLGKQSCYLFGRDRTVVDIPTEHPSCSKQHAVIQFRQVTKRNDFGDVQRSVRPFLIDLDSANGCYVNGEDVPRSRYYELRSGDTCQFGASAREYVLLDEAAT